MHESHKPAAKAVGFPTMIAWFSVCLLAAAWGSAFDATWHAVWAELGAFGLAAAVGLEVNNRIRMARAATRYEYAQRARVEHGLSRLNEQNATLDAINEALRRLTLDCQQSKFRDSRGSPWSSRRGEVLSGQAVEISPVEQHGAECRLARAVAGRVRRISSSAISLVHPEPIAVQVVLATFTLDDGERVSFVVDLLWSERTDEGFTSGGTMLAVGTPAEEAALADASAVSACP